MKKILAGVLASASLLTMTTSAFASEKKVTATGDVEYDVAATTPKVVLNLIMPAKMSAALNPYEADIKLNADVLDDEGNVTTAATTTNAGIASAAYELVNMSLDYGIVIDASATTTITAAKGETWAVKTTDPVDGTKGAQMAVVTAADVDALKTVMEGALTETPGSIMMLDSAKPSKQKKFISIGAASKTTDEENPIAGASAVMGFAGKLAGSSDTKDVEWTEEDAINVALVLKVVAGPKGATTNNPGPGDTVTAATAITALTISDDDNAGVTLPTFDKDTTSYTIAGCSRNDNYTFTITVESGYSYQIDDKGSNVTVTGDTVKVGNTSGTNEIDVVVTNDANSTDTATYTFTFTA